MKLIVLLLLITTGCTVTPYVTINNHKIHVELARTPNEIRQGLMFREQLCESCGMLFVLSEGRHTFWMKNTKIPLDMIFINSDMRVVDILHAQPCVDEPCELYTPRENASYVLEVNQNIFDESIINQQVKLNRIN
ncbi:MAG: DUF192 domain-containing protein [Candidatus Woesearchaeota archaeon]